MIVYLSIQNTYIIIYIYIYTYESILDTITLCTYHGCRGVTYGSMLSTYDTLSSEYNAYNLCDAVRANGDTHTSSILISHVNVGIKLLN